MADVLLSDDRARRLHPDTVFDRLPLSFDQFVADIGCGPGFFTIPLARRVTEGAVFALDTQPAMLDRLRDRLTEQRVGNVVVAQNTETALPLPPNAMDGMFVAMMLHEAAEDRVRFLDLLARHAKPAGWLAVLDWHRIPTPMGPPQELRLEPDEVSALLRASQWELVADPVTLGEWFHLTVARRRVVRRTPTSPAPEIHSSRSAVVDPRPLAPGSATPVISVVGRKNSGKTTFLEKLIPELRGRGYRIGVLKHDVHGFQMDQPGKDTWRFSQAGADVVAIASPERFALIERLRQEPDLDALVARLAPEVDILLTEGYRGSSLPKVEISRTERSTELICSPQELLAVVTDHDNVPLGVPRLPLGDAAGVATVIEERFGLKRRGAGG